MKKRSHEAAIIKAFKEREGDFISGEDLAKTFCISRAAIWKHIKNLQDKGYSIEAVPRRGYRLLSSPDMLLPEEVALRLQTRRIGHAIVHRTLVDSTNALAKQLAEKGEPEGTVLLAEEQYGGRGRLDRSWASPPGGIWFSVILRPQILPSYAPRFTLLVAVAVAKAIERHGLKPAIKWPNDVVLDGKKICGILLELSAEPDRVAYLIIGVGINANVDIADLPEESRARATSLSRELGKKIDRAKLLADVLAELEREYRRLMDGDWEGIRQDWLKRCNMLGVQISLETMHGVVEGECVGVDAFGAVKIRYDDGRVKSYAAGDVTVKRER